MKNIIVLLIICSFSLSAQSQNSTQNFNLHGKWKMNFFSSEKNINNLTDYTKLLHSIEQNGNDLTLMYGGRTSGSGKLEGNKLKFNYSDGNEGYTFEGYAFSNEIIGELKTADGFTIPFKAERLGSGWHCGNHEISHYAESTDDIKLLTESMGCSNWQK